MSGLDGAPVPVGGYSVYDSYATDPPYQTYLTISWAVFLGLAALAALPTIVRYIGNGRGREGWLMLDDWRNAGRGYMPIKTEKAMLRSPAARRHAAGSTVKALVDRVTLTTLPGPLPLRVGTLAIILLIPVVLLATILPESQLSENPNRLGFIALACLPPVFLLSAKASPLSLLTGIAYNRVNILHRWLGRALFGVALAHGGTWITQWQQQGSTADHFEGQKEQYGLMALSFLALLFFTSWRPVRAFSYPLFFICHVVGFTGFLVAISLHTIYSRSWIGYGVVPIYTIDLVFRAARLRLTEARAQALPGGATRITIDDISGGWRAGQHVQLRALYAPGSPLKAGLRSTLFSWLRPFESHPFTLSRAPPSISVLPEAYPTVVARTQAGRTWTSDLHDYAATAPAGFGKPMTVLVEGLYGGLGYREPYTSESVLLVAGGTGASFIVAILDEIIGRVVRGLPGAVTKYVDVLWAVRDRDCIGWYGATFDALIAAAAPHNLTIRINIHLTSPSSSSTSAPSHYHPTHCTVVSTSSTRPSCSLALRKAIRDAINPCQTCLVCACPPGPHGCADDLDSCCDAAPAGSALSEVIPLQEVPATMAGKRPSLTRSSESTVSSYGGATEKTPLSTDGVAVLGKTKACCATDKTEEKAGGCCGARDGAMAKEVPAAKEVRAGGLCVCVCGPASMIADVSNAVARVPLASARRIGGIELISEAYDL